MKVYHHITVSLVSSSIGLLGFDGSSLCKHEDCKTKPELSCGRFDSEIRTQSLLQFVRTSDWFDVACKLKFENSTSNWGLNVRHDNSDSVESGDDCAIS